jgi:hypothetical protein
MIAPMVTKKRSQALSFQLLARKKGQSVADRVLTAQANKTMIDNQRLQRVQAFEKARHGKNLFGLEDAS